jgi:hypothetical protein
MTPKNSPSGTWRGPGDDLDAERLGAGAQHAEVCG